MTDQQLQKHAAEVDKLQAETHKLVAENIHIMKKNIWFELTLMFAVVAASVAFTKLFL